jgi:large conductance mechanosensitive channel
MKVPQDVRGLAGKGRAPLKFMQEFREFASRGNVIDLAVGVIIGAAFGKIVASLVKDVIMPPIGLLLGGVDFSEYYINLSGTSYPNLAEATKAGAATINYGVFINTCIEFLIVAFSIFVMVRVINRLQRQPAPTEADAAPTTKDCPYCLSPIPVMATKCAHCTADLPAPTKTS